VVNDARFLSRDLLDRRSEVLLMIQSDRRDDGQERVHDVSAVQPPAHSDFQHCDINPGI
jgi:hypothetical protein